MTEKHVLYKITNITNNRFYIGAHSTSNLDDGYMGSGKQIIASVKKHGKEAHTFEILDTFETRSKLMDAERAMVTQDLILSRVCMNMRVGGEGFSSSDMKRIWARPGHREKQASAKRGKTFTEEHKAKMSVAAKARGPQSEEARAKNSASNTGKKMSSEAREKMSAAAKARKPMSDETRKKISAASKIMWADQAYRKTNLEAKF